MNIRFLALSFVLMIGLTLSAANEIPTSAVPMGSAAQAAGVTAPVAKPAINKNIEILKLMAKGLLAGVSLYCGYIAFQESKNAYDTLGINISTLPSDEQTNYRDYYFPAAQRQLNFERLAIPCFAALAGLLGRDMVTHFKNAFGDSSAKK